MKRKAVEGLKWLKKGKLMVDGDNRDMTGVLERKNGLLILKEKLR